LKINKTPSAANNDTEKEKQKEEFKKYMKHMGHRVLNRKNFVSAEPRNKD
jgi:hypothetical protein